MAATIFATCFLISFSYWTTNFIEIIAIVLSPVIAVYTGEYMRIKNYDKKQREDLICRIIKYGYQMSPTYRGEKNKILEALNEIKYWYFDHSLIQKLFFVVTDKMKIGQDAQATFVELIQTVASTEGRHFTKMEVERVFSTH